MREDGAVVFWGYLRGRRMRGHLHGRLIKRPRVAASSPQGSERRYVAIAAGDCHSLALREDALLVRNISYDCRKEDLADRFREYGEIRDVYVPVDYHSQYVVGRGGVGTRARASRRPAAAAAAGA